MVSAGPESGTCGFLCTRGLRGFIAAPAPPRRRARAAEGAGKFRTSVAADRDRAKAAPRSRSRAEQRAPTGGIRRRDATRRGRTSARASKVSARSRRSTAIKLGGCVGELGNAARAGRCIVSHRCSQSRRQCASRAASTQLRARSSPRRCAGGAMNRLRQGWYALLMVLAGPLAQAHIASNGFVTLKVVGGEVSGAVELAIRDGELAVGLDRDGDGRVTWRELRSSQTALQNYVAGHLGLQGDDAPCRVGFGPVQVNERVDGSYLWLPIRADCGAKIKRLSIDYRMLDAEDPSHRGLLTLTNGAAQTAVLGGASGPRQFDLDRASPGSAFIDYLRAGIWHIWSGIDHLLFLLSLLLPAVLVRRQNRWVAVPMAAPALGNIVKVVTAFPLAHSITLSLAAFDVIRLPSRLTESVIAASIIA